MSISRVANWAGGRKWIGRRCIPKPPTPPANPLLSPNAPPPQIEPEVYVIVFLLRTPMRPSNPSFIPAKTPAPPIRGRQCQRAQDQRTANGCAHNRRRRPDQESQRYPAGNAAKSNAPRDAAGATLQPVRHRRSPNRASRRKSRWKKLPKRPRRRVKPDLLQPVSNPTPPESTPAPRRAPKTGAGAAKPGSRRGHATGRRRGPPGPLGGAGCQVHTVRRIR